MSMMVSFVLSFFPRDVLDEILNLIESVSEDFPSYFCMTTLSFVKTTESYLGIIHLSPSIGKPRMTLVSFVKTME